VGVVLVRLERGKRLTVRGKDNRRWPGEHRILVGDWHGGSMVLSLAKGEGGGPEHSHL